jgi:hypothetical protein
MPAPRSYNVVSGRSADQTPRDLLVNEAGWLQSEVTAKDYAAVLTSNTITRPADTTAYSSGDLVANSTTAGSVTAFSFTNAARVAAGSLRIDRVRLYKSGTSAANASFRVHLYNANPSGIANGDNGAWLTSIAGYIGAFDLSSANARTFSDGVELAGIPMVGSSILTQLASGTTLYALIEARGAYTPVSAETFTLRAEVYRF